MAKVARFVRRRIRRAWTADSWTVGMSQSAGDGLEKIAWVEGRMEAADWRTAKERRQRLYHILI